MQFQVPQFIDVEDKLFGPLTFKQFVYLVGGAGLCFLIYVFVPGILAYLFIAPVAALALALAFWEINKKPFIFTLEAAIKYTFNKKIYIWKKHSPQNTAPEEEKKTIADELLVPKLSDSKLKDLSWSLDVHKKIQ